MQEEIQQKLGERIKAAIESSPFNQLQLAERLEISENTLTHYVKGRRVPDALMLDRVSQLLDVSLEWLSRGKGTMKGNPDSHSKAAEGRDLTEAKRVVNDHLLKGRTLPPDKMDELVSLVADEIVALRALGRESDLLRKVERWVEASQALRSQKPTE